jgi:hypothetical protein
MLTQCIKHIYYLILYCSQIKTFVRRLPLYIFRQLLHGTQILQAVNFGIICERPHEGLLLYERRKFYSYWECADKIYKFISYAGRMNNL